MNQKTWKLGTLSGSQPAFGCQAIHEEDRLTRATAANIVPETARTTLTQNTFNNDAKKLWNKAPCDIKNAKTLSSAKKAIKNASPSPLFAWHHLWMTPKAYLSNYLIAIRNLIFAKSPNIYYLPKLKVRCVIANISKVGHN